MSAILVNTKNKAELKFVKVLLQKLNLEIRVLDYEEQEDIFDILSIKEVENEETIDFEAFAKSQGLERKTLQTA